MPQDLKDYVEQFQLHPMTVIFLICAIYVLLGTAMEELSMILLTVPVLFPLVALNISAVVEGYQWTPPALLGLLLVMLGNVLVFRRPKPRAVLLGVNEGG